MDSEYEHVTCSIEILNSKSKSSYSCHLCSTIVKTNSNLKAHLIKTHHLVESPADEAFYSKKKCKINVIYHCPIENCKYNISTGKGVNKFSVLKQHYNWVHVPHAFSCISCNKSFGTEPALKYHKKNCGQRFTCSICKSDFAEEKFLTYHRNRIHLRKNQISKTTCAPSENTAFENSNQPVKILQPIYIPMIFPMNISDPVLLNSLKDSTIANMDLLNKLNVFKPETKDVETQVDMFVQSCSEMKSMCNNVIGPNVLSYPQLINNNNNNNNNNDNNNNNNNNNNNSVNCISYDWANIDSNNCQFYANNTRDYLNSCNASMQTVPYNSYDNFFNVETQTNLAGFVGRDMELTYGNMSVNDDLMSSLFSEVGCLKQESGDEFLRLSDNHTQTGPYPIDMNNLVDLNDIETQTNLQDIDDLLFTN